MEQIDPDIAADGRAPRRDPWVLGGLALLAALSLAAVLLYRSAPQSVAEVGSQTWLAARPNAYGPNLTRARERLEAARAEAAAGRDSVAMEIDSTAAVHAWRARELASGPEEQSAATRLWAEAVLHWAELLRRQGTGAGLRPDDNETLRRALALTQQVRATAPDPELRARADSLEIELDRQLRPGPLEWLPRRR